MSILQARGLTLRVAQELPLFAAADFEIAPGDRVGVIGPNGAGKSSLLRLIAGELEADGGVLIRRKGLALARYGQGYDEAGEDDVSAELRGLGWDPDAALSSGQRSRERLARALARPADLLLLDEPTNHLDAKARQWLERYLLRQERTCLVVSHDEAFLRAVATRIFALRRGVLTVFNGGYDGYLEFAAMEGEKAWAAYDGEQRQLAALARAAERRDVLAAKVAKAPPGVRLCRDFYGRKAGKVARTGRLLRERLPEEARVAKPFEEQGIPRLEFLGCGRAGDPPLELAGVAVGYGGRAVVAGLDLVVRRGERVALVGPNGCGKTTLLRAVLGEVAVMAGAVRLGHAVRVGYYGQEGETLDLAETPVAACLRGCADVTWVRTMLACLHLPRRCAEMPTGALSQGERAKTALAQVLTGGANLLLLDEPTNHLELEARAALAGALGQFPGTVVFVSHDAGFRELVGAREVDVG